MFPKKIILLLLFLNLKIFFWISNVFSTIAILSLSINFLASNNSFLDINTILWWDYYLKNYYYQYQVKDINLPKDVRILNAADQVIALVNHPTVEQEETEIDDQVIDSQDNSEVTEEE